MFKISKFSIQRAPKMYQNCGFGLKINHLATLVPVRRCPCPVIFFVQTTSDYTPTEALRNAITDLISELSLFEERFRESVREKLEGYD
jgi:DNA-directed RNA polymerase subunit L